MRALAVAALTVLMLQPAEAAHCRPGQIWMRHAHHCIGRAYRYRHEARRPRHERVVVEVREVVRVKRLPAKACLPPIPEDEPSGLYWPGPWVRAGGFPSRAWWQL